MHILWFTLIHVFILYILKVWKSYLMSKYIRFQINDIIQYYFNLYAQRF